MSGFWCMPSGHVEQGELITDALIRETEEEVRIKVRRKDLRLLHTMFRAKHDETGERVDFFFTADSFEGEPQNGEPAKCAEVRWFPKDALPKNIVPNQLLAIKSIWNGIPFSEYPSNFFPAK
jgi:ADP-ribose pyrophosphatase YjhB (NUDIX family)